LRHSASVADWLADLVEEFAIPSMLIKQLADTRRWIDNTDRDYFGELPLMIDGKPA
jgi:hypothetical protein